MVDERVQAAIQDAEKAATQQAQEATKEQEAEEKVEAEEGEEQVQEVEETIPLRRFNQVYGRMKELERLNTQLARNIQDDGGRKPPPEDDIPDLESMSSKDLVRWNLNKMKTLIDESVGKHLAPLRTESRQEAIRRDVETTASKHPDFWDYQEEIVTIAERHPTLSSEEAYLLATGNIDAAKRSVTKRMKDKVALKKAAKTETRSSPVERQVEQKEFKTVREAGLAQAKKLGLI